MRGGALFNFVGDVIVENCTFENNTALPISGASGDFIDLFGGAIFLDSGADGELVNCEFNGNDAQDKGGAIYTESDDVNLFNCLFYKNTCSLGNGAAIALVGASPQIVNCTFTDNVENVPSTGVIHALNSSPIIQNVILWNDGLDEIFLQGSSSIDVLNSIVQGGYSQGLNILDVVPEFVDKNNEIYSLRSCSPAIEQGLNSLNPTSLDLAGNPRIHKAVNNSSEATIDIGAYEFQETYTPECPCPEELVLTGLIDGGTYEASISITCNGIIEAGIDVVFSAPTINLQEDFELEDTATLETQTLGCMNN